MTNYIKLLKKEIKKREEILKIIAEIMEKSNKIKNPYVNVKFCDFLVDNFLEQSKIIDGIRTYIQNGVGKNE
jgi:hypothetical protein